MPVGGEAVGRVWFWWFRVYYCNGTAGSERLGTFIVADINGFVLGICSGDLFWSGKRDFAFVEFATWSIG